MSRTRWDVFNDCGLFEKIKVNRKTPDLRMKIDRWSDEMDLLGLWSLSSQEGEEWFFVRFLF